MRNLKRVLSLVMAMVMLLGMMTIGAAAASADFTDASEITYVEAIDVLTGIGVMEGIPFEGSDDLEFDPGMILNRVQAAAMMTRIIAGPANAAKVSANAEQIFIDVPSTHWAAGYIRYCANLGLLAGYEGYFYPDQNLTGVAFAKMLLVALGYNAEYEGYAGRDGVYYEYDVDIEEHDDFEEVMAEYKRESGDDYHNTVLVSYNSKNEIVYAISFAHEDGDDPNEAQNVWEIMVREEPGEEEIDPPVVTFYGVTATAAFAGVGGTADYEAKVSYGDAVAAIAANKPSIDVEGGDIVLPVGFEIPTGPVEGGTTYTGTILGDDGNYYSFTLEQDAKITTVGQLISTDDTNNIVVTAQDPDLETATINVQTASKTTLRTLQNMLASTQAGDTVTLKGYDVNDVELNDEETVAEADKIVVTITNVDGVEQEFTVTIDGTTRTYYTLTLESNVKAYSDNALTTELTGNKVKSGDTVYFGVRGTGVLYAADTDDYSAGRTKSLSANGSAPSGWVSGSISVTCNLTVTFYPAVDGEIKTVNLLPEIVEKYGATSTGVQYHEDGEFWYMDITVDKRTAVPTATSGSASAFIAEWFGIHNNNNIGQAYGNGYEGTGLVYGYHERAGKVVMTADGTDGGDTFYLHIYIDYVAPETTTYSVEFTSATNAAQTLVITDENDNTSTTAITSVTIYKENGDADILIEAVTGYPKNLSGGTHTENLTLGLTASDTIYAVVVIDGQTLTTAPIYVQST